MPTLLHLLLALLVATAIAVAAWKAKALTPSGAFAAAGVGFAIFGFAGGRGAFALLLFFVTSSVLSRLGKKRKEKLGYEKGGTRDVGQVLANGAVASVFALIAGWASPVAYPALIVGMLGAIATANADTWATEIGSLFGGKPRRITNFRQTEPGESGAISAIGTLAALGGAFLIGFMALTWQFGRGDVEAVVVGGVCGALFDSFLGATIQVQYRDKETGRLTERPFAESGTGHHVARGLAWVNNDMVNLLSTLVGAWIAFMLVAATSLD